MKMVSSRYNLDVAVPLDRIEMLVIPAEKNQRVYLGKGDCLFQRFQAAGEMGSWITNGEGGFGVSTFGGTGK